MWPAIANRSPFLFYDTSQYLSIGRSIVAQIPLVRSLASPAEHLAGAPDAAGAAPQASRDKTEHPSLAYAGGRSAYYSALAYVLASLGGLWLMALAQACVALFVLWTLATAMNRNERLSGFLWLAGVLALVSPLPFYLTMAMPDVFAGLGLLALGVLLFGRCRLSRASRIGLLLVAAWSAATHLSTFAVMLLTCLGGALIGARVGKVDRRSLAHSLAWGLSPLVIAGAGMLVYSTATRLVLGGAPKSPPYLMSRVLADGPGRAYLLEACAASQPYVLCAFKDRAFENSDDILWSGDAAVGVFQIAALDVRKQLQSEELSFVVHTILRHPLWQLQVSLQHFGDQLLHFGISNEFAQAAPSWDQMSFNAMLPHEAAAYRNGLAYRGLFPFAVFERIQAVAVVASLLFLMVRLTRADVRAALVSGACRNPAFLLALCFALLIVALLVNAAVCGVLSGVYDRYQARIVWLAPGLAVVTWRVLGARLRLSRSG